MSFSVQQRRATILAGIFAREYEGKERGKLQIAIVGGGLAGVTLFGILRCIGFSGTSLFESDPDELLTLQAEAPHRLAHPSYNTWPSFSDFESTTRDLPMFRWAAGPVDDVIEQIRRQFEDFLELETNARADIHKGHEVEEVIEIRNSIGVNGVQLKFKTGRDSNFRADFAVATMGFGAELSVNNTDRYWQADHLEVAKKNIRKGEGNRFVIAGNGDGALIDAARIAFSGDTKGIEVFTELHLPTIFSLRPRSYQRPAKGIKSARKYIENSQNKSKAETVISKIEKKLALNSTEEGALDALNAYLQDSRFNSATSIGTAKICAKCAKSLRIVGNRDNLLTPGTAPINKIIVSQVFKQGCQTTKGHLMVRSPSDGSLSVPENEAPGEYTIQDIQDSRTTISKHDSELNSRNTKVLCRIGAKPQVISVCRGSETEAFEEHFSKIGNLQEFDGIIDPNGLTAFQVISKEVGEPSIYEIEPFARDHVLKWFGEKYSLFVVPEEEQLAAHFMIEHPHNEDPAQCAKKLGGFDHHLFGVPVYFRKRSKSGDKFNFKPFRRRNAA